MPETTPLLGLQKPLIGEEGWGVTLRGTIDALDGHQHPAAGPRWRSAQINGDQPASALGSVLAVQDVLGVSTFGAVGQNFAQGGSKSLILTAGATVGPVYLLASEATTVAQVGLRVERLADADGTIIVPVLLPLVVTFAPPLATHPLSTYPAILIGGTDFAWAQSGQDDANWTVGDGTVTVKQPGHYSVGVAVTWGGDPA